MLIQHIENFITLAKLLNFTEASEKLFISQSTLSRQISAIEEEVGAKLFNRNTHTVSLTMAGEKFLKDATAMVLSYNRGIANARKYNGNYTDTLKLGYLAYGADVVINPIIREFKKMHSEVEVIPREYSNVNLTNGLLNGTLDVAIQLSNAVLGVAGLEFKNFKEGTIDLVVYKEHPLAGRKMVSIKDFVNERLVYLDNCLSSSYYSLITNAYMVNGLFPNYAVKSNSVFNQLMMVECGYGVAILSHFCNQKMKENLVRIPIKDIVAPNLVVAWRKGYFTSSIELFVEFLKNF